MSQDICFMSISKTNFIFSTLNCVKHHKNDVDEHYYEFIFYEHFGVNLYSYHILIVDVWIQNHQGNVILTYFSNIDITQRWLHVF